MSVVANRVHMGALLTLSVVIALMLVMTHAIPALSQSTSTVMVSNLGQPSSVLRTTILGDQKYAQSFCTGSVAANLDKVRLYTLSNETDPNAMFYRYDPAPVVTIRSTDAWGKPGEVLHTLTSPVIDDSMDTAEDFTSSGYELAANTTYSVVIHRPNSTGHIAFLSTTSPSEDTETQLGWAIGDQYMYYAGHGWTDNSHEGLVMKMAISASGALPSISTPAFTDSDCDGTAGAFDFSVDENSAEHTIVGVAAAGDPDGDSITYSVSGTDAAKFNNVFNLNASTGEITVKSGASIDYESSDKSYSITVSVTDGEDASGDAESPPTTDATTSVSIEVINIDEPGIVTLSTTAPRVGSELTATLSDPDSSVLVYTVQWARAANADAPFIDIPIDPGYMANPTYTPTAADQGKYLKVTMFYAERTCGEVSNFDDRCRSEAEFAFDTLVANEEGLIVQSQRVNSPATGQPRITGTPPAGYYWFGWLSLYANRNSVRDADGMSAALFSYQWVRVDPNTLAEENIQNPENPGWWWTYVPQTADLGKGLKVRISFIDNQGNRESRTSPLLSVPSPPSNAATGAPTINGTPSVGEPLTTSTSGISDAEGLFWVSYSYQWLADDVEISGATGRRYTVAAADGGKAIKVRVTFTDDAGNDESLTSNAVAVPASIPLTTPLTATIHDEPESHDGSAAFIFELRFSEEPAGAFGYLTLQQHALTVAGGTLPKVRRLEAGKNLRWEITVQPSSNADVTITLPVTTDCAAQGAICTVANKMLSSALEFTVSGPGTSDQQSPPENSAATGAPTINGTARVGETLTASTSGISDTDGLTNASFTYQWLADNTDISGATGTSYTVVTADAGKVIKVTVSFTDDAGNEESVTSAATAAVTQPPLTASTHDVPESHDGATAFTFELRFSEEPGGGFSATTLRDQALTVSGGTITNVRQLETGKKLKWEITLQPSGNEEVTVILLPTIDCADQGAICTGDGRGLSVGQAILVLGPPNSAATGAPTINGTAQVGESLTASTSDISDANGLANASFTYQWLADDADISGATGSSYTLVAADVGKAIKVRVSFTDDAGNEESVTSAATAAVIAANTSATGAPTIGGTARVGESLTASTSDISDADGLANASFTYQWLADDADINGATTSSYTVVAADAGKTIKVQVSFTDDDGNEESVTSTATAVTQPPLTATIHDEPSSHDGSAEFTFELRFSEAPTDSFSYTKVRDHAFTVTEGSVSNVRRLEPGKNVKWEITVTPDSDADVTIAVNATTDCSVEGAICTDDGGKLSGGLEMVVPGPQENSAATGAPTISGTAQVGQTLIASTSGIADADGVANATFTYQWLADDADISDGTGSSYTLVAADEGKVITVTVSFTDDADNDESLTSAATTAVAKPPLTAAVHDKPSSHDGSTAFTFELRLSEAPVDTFSYVTLHLHALTVTGGTVDKARRVESGKNVRWEITVTPDSGSDVTIVLPITSDCTAQGAICTGDGRKLSNRLEFTVPGTS